MEPKTHMPQGNCKVHVHVGVRIQEAKLFTVGQWDAKRWNGMAWPGELAGRIKRALAAATSERL